MRLLFIAALLIFSANLQAQLTIKIVLKKQSGVLGYETIYVHGNQAPLTDTTEIRNHIQKGGSFVIQAADGLNATYRIEKIGAANTGNSVLQQGTGIPPNSKEFKFNSSFEFKEFDLPENMQNATLNNILIDVAADGVPRLQIKLDEMTKSFLSPLPIKELKNDCDSCLNNYAFADEMVIFYDFVCKCFYELKGNTKEKVSMAELKIKRRKQVRLIIENVNRYLYDVSVKGETVNLESQMPALFRNFFLGDSSKLLGTLMETTLNSMKLNETLKNSFEVLNTMVGNYMRKINHLKAKKASSFVVCTRFDCCDSKNFVANLESLLNDLGNIRVLVYRLNKELAMGESKVELMQLVEDTKQALIDCRSENRRLSRLIKAKEIELSTEKDPAKKKAIQAEINKAKDGICSEDEQVRLTTELRNVSEKLVLYKTIEDLALHLPNDEFVSDLSLYVANMTKENGRSLQTPIYVDGNRVEFSIHIRPNDTSYARLKSITPLQSDSFSLILPVNGRPQYNFSSGSFMAIGKHLIAKTYDWQRLSTSGNVAADSFRLVESGYTPLPLGFSAFLSVEWKLSRNIGIGPSFGVGITIEKIPRFGYMAGGSIFFGERKQIAATVGFLAMPVNTIKNNFLDIYNKQTIYKTPPAIEYYKEKRIGGFVSLTYTPFNEIRTRQTRSGR